MEEAWQLTAMLHKAGTAVIEFRGFLLAQWNYC